MESEENNKPAPLMTSTFTMAISQSSGSQKPGADPPRSLTIDSSRDECPADHKSHHRASYSLDLGNPRSRQGSEDPEELTRRGVMVTDIDQAIIEHETMMARVNSLKSQKPEDSLSTAMTAPVISPLTPDDLNDYGEAFPNATTPPSNNMDSSGSTYQKLSRSKGLNEGQELFAEDDSADLTGNMLNGAGASNVQLARINLKEYIHWPDEIPDKLNFSHLEVFQGKSTSTISFFFFFFFFF